MIRSARISSATRLARCNEALRVSFQRADERANLARSTLAKRVAAFNKKFGLFPPSLAGQTGMVRAPLRRHGHS
jgi:hypothetical protein